MRLRTASTHWNVSGKCGPHGELFFFLLVFSELVEFGPCHGMCLRSDMILLPDLAVVWKCGCPKSPVWSDDGLEEERGEDTSFALCGAATALNGQEVKMLLLWSITSTTSESRFFGVVGQNWSSEVISLFQEDWEVGRVAISCHLSMDFVCSEMRNACRESSDSLGSPRSVFRVPGRKEEVF